MGKTTLTAAVRHARACHHCDTKPGAKKYDGLCHECFYAEIMAVGETACKNCDKKVMITYRGLCRPCIEQADAVQVRVVCTVCEEPFYCRGEKEFQKCLGCRRKSGNGQYGKRAMAEGAIALFRSPGPSEATCGKWDNVVRALDSIGEE